MESFLRTDPSREENAGRRRCLDGCDAEGRESFGSSEIRVISEPDKGVYDAMNKGLHLFKGDAIGFLSSDDTFHDDGALTAIATALEAADVVYGSLDIGIDHRSKTVVRA